MEPALTYAADAGAFDTPVHPVATSAFRDSFDSGLAIAPLLALMRRKQLPWLGSVGCDAARWLL